MSENCSCGCGNGIKLLYSCSGAANTGLLADSVSRKLMRENYGKMTCLAAVGAELSGFIESAKSATTNIVIDGCPVACGKKIFDKAEMAYQHFILTDFGVEKGKTEITSEVINNISEMLITKL